MHVILSVPRPSEAARFDGQILSSIDSTILDIYMPFCYVPIMAEPPLTRGDTAGPVLPKALELDLLRPRAEVAANFFCGEAPALRT